MNGIILALDYDTNDNEQYIITKSLSIINEVGDMIYGIKIKPHLLTVLSMSATKQIITYAHEHGLEVLADIKLNDIGSANVKYGKLLWNIGVDSIIVNPITGFDEGLEPLIKNAHDLNKKVIFLVYMSHKGADDFYNLSIGKSKLYELFTQKAIDWKADGVVIGATRPDIIAKVYNVIRGHSIPIYSTGIGTQGGSVHDIIEAGTDYLIIGRTIIESKEPIKVIEELVDAYE